MEKNILTKLAIISFILSFLIVCHHAFTTDISYINTFNPVVYGWNQAIQRYLYNISECAVPIFYFLSAYLFFRSYDGSWIQYKRKIYRRFFSLFIPYVVFCTLGYIKHAIASGEHIGFVGWLTELFLCETMPLWFIRELLALSLLAPCFFWMKKKIWASMLILPIIIVLVSIGLIEYRSFVYWIPVYMLGVNFNKNWWDNINVFVKKYHFIFITLISIYAITCWFLPNCGETRGGYENSIYLIFRILTPLIFIPTLIFITNSTLQVRKWMNYAFFVYCMHFPIITILTIIYDRICSPFVHSELIKYFLIVAITYTLCVLIAMFCQRFMPKFWSVINGGR